MKKSLRVVTLLGAGAIAASVGASLSSCNSGDQILIWGPVDHETIYLEAAQEYAAANDWDVTFAYAGNGDAGAYGAMSTDPTSGAAVYTFANDMLANLNRIGAVAPVAGDNLAWARENHVESAVEAGKMGDTYYGYPVSADNGYFLYYNQEAFVNTSVWDSTTNDLKEGFTFPDLYNALDEHDDSSKWSDGIVTWPIGDSWYGSGVFFAAGGDYEITYNDAGEQTSAKCWFGYTTDDEGNEDYTVGLDAAWAMRKSISQDNGDTVSPHYLFSDGSTAPLNDQITKYIAANVDTPLAAVVCGTWKSQEIKTAWGDNARATVLPKLENKAGDKINFTTFAGYKLMGINPLCRYAQQSEENLLRLHDFAKYLTGEEISIKRFESTGLGPSNKAAQQNEAVANDYSLVALNKQYDVAYHVQGSVPANYWTPIQNFGTGLFTGMRSGDAQYETDVGLCRLLKSMQADIEGSTQ